MCDVILITVYTFFNEKGILLDAYMLGANIGEKIKFHIRISSSLPMLGG